MRCGEWATAPPRSAGDGLLAWLTAFGRPRPGDVVWGPVRYMDKPWESKDRPVLVVGREGGCLLVLMLSSKVRRHDDWYAIGTGPWDPQRRPSRVRLHPYYRLAPGDVRRRGGRVERHVQSSVRAALTHRFGWPAR